MRGKPFVAGVFFEDGILEQDFTRGQQPFKSRKGFQLWGIHQSHGPGEPPWSQEVKSFSRRASGEEFLHLSGFVFKHLHSNPARCGGVAFNTQRSQFTHDHGVKPSGFQTRPGQFCLCRAERFENCYKVHTFIWVISPRGNVGEGCRSANTITPAPVCRVLCTCASTWWPM